MSGGYGQVLAPTQLPASDLGVGLSGPQLRAGIGTLFQLVSSLSAVFIHSDVLMRYLSLSVISAWSDKYVGCRLLVDLKSKEAEMYQDLAVA